MSIVKKQRIRGRLHVWFAVAPEHAFIVHRSSVASWRRNCPGGKGWRLTHRGTSFAAGTPSRTQAEAIAKADADMERLGTQTVLDAIASAERKKKRKNTREGVWTSFRKVAGDLRQFHPKKAATA